MDTSANLASPETPQLFRHYKGGDGDMHKLPQKTQRDVFMMLNAFAHKAGIIDGEVMVHQFDLKRYNNERGIALQSVHGPHVQLLFRFNDRGPVATIKVICRVGKYLKYDDIEHICSELTKEFILHLDLHDSFQLSLVPTHSTDPTDVEEGVERSETKKRTRYR